MSFVVDDKSILQYWSKIHFHAISEDPDQVESALRGEAPVRDLPASPTLDSADKPVRIRRSVLFSIEKVKNPTVKFDGETFHQLKKEHKILPPVRIEQEALRKDQNEDIPDTIAEVDEDVDEWDEEAAVAAAAEAAEDKKKKKGSETPKSKRRSSRNKSPESGSGAANDDETEREKKSKKKKGSGRDSSKKKARKSKIVDLFISDDENHDESVPSEAQVLFPRMEIETERSVSHALKNALLSLPAPDLSKSEVADKPIELRVSVKSGDDTWSFVNVVCNRNAKVQRVLELVLQESKKVVFLNTDPTAYMLMLADADGRPDEDFAVALGMDQPIIRFNTNTFAMQKNKKSKEADDSNQKPEDLFQAAPQYRGFKDFQVLKIQMPDESYLHLPYQPDAVLNKLLVLTCQKRGLSATEYTFVDPSSFEEMDVSVTLGDVGVGVLRVMKRESLSTIAKEMRLKEASKTKQRKGSFVGSDGKRGPLFFLTPAIAAQYKTYSVMKVNPYGLKQQRVMGVAATEITNFKGDDAEEQANAGHDSGGAAAGGSGDAADSLTSRLKEKEKPRRLSFMSLRDGVNRVRKRSSTKDGDDVKSVAQTKHPTRPISDILECDMDPKRGSKAFFIRFKEKTINYESTDAAEIVAKINFLLNMHKNPAVSIIK